MSFKATGLRAQLAVLAGALALVGCGDAGGGDTVYDQPLPSISDSAAHANIASQLNAEDKEVWDNLVLRFTMISESEVESKTVGEAIERERAKLTCRDETSDFDAKLACADGPI
jgi:hypothetical protein